MITEISQMLIPRLQTSNLIYGVLSSGIGQFESNLTITFANGAVDSVESLRPSAEQLHRKQLTFANRHLPLP